MFDKAIPSDIKTWTLHFGSRQFSLSSASGSTVTWSVESSYVLTQNQMISLSLTAPSAAPPRPRPTIHPAVIESPEGVRVGALTDDGYPITLDEEEGSFLYRKKTIDITVMRDEECMSNPAVILSKNILDRGP